MLFIVATLALAAIAQEKERSIVGVWKVTELLSRAPGENWTNVTPQLSLYIFTQRHYSYMYTLGEEPRPLFACDFNDNRLTPRW